MFSMLMIMTIFSKEIHFLNMFKMIIFISQVNILIIIIRFQLSKAFSMDIKEINLEIIIEEIIKLLK
jgi:hypothetical protein